MTTMHSATACDPAAVTNPSAVESILQSYRVTPDWKLTDDNSKLMINGYESFVIWDTDEPVTADVLNELREYIQPGEELKIDTVGYERPTFPLVATRYVVTPTTVTVTDLFADGETLSP